MSNPVHRRLHPVRRRVATALIVALTATSFLPAVASASATVNLSFAEWWAPQMAGHNSLQNLVNQFEHQNPGITITLDTNPYPTVESQTLAQAASVAICALMSLLSRN